MKILKAYKTELDPTCKQVVLLRQHAGAARWAYNWGLARKIESFKATGKNPFAIDLHKELNLLKKLPKEEGGVPWMYSSSKCPRFYPSSKTCSACGHVKEKLLLSERTFRCHACGFEIDRDLNAAINLKNLAGSSPATACCPESTGERKRAKLLVGQEPRR